MIQIYIYIFLFKIRSKHSLSNHIDKKKKDSLDLDKSPVHELDDTIILEEVESPINISRLQRQFCLGLYLLEPTLFCFVVNATKIYKFKAKKSEIVIVFRKYFKNVRDNDMKKKGQKQKLNDYEYHFFVDYYILTIVISIIFINI